MRSINSARLSDIDEGLRELVKMMLNTSPELRPDNHDFLKSPYFDDIGVKTLNYLDSIFQWDNLEKSKFYKGLYIDITAVLIADRKLTKSRMLFFIS